MLAGCLFCRLEVNARGCRYATTNTRDRRCGGLPLPAPVSLGFLSNDPAVADLHVSGAITMPPRRVKETRGKAISLAKFLNPVTCSFFHNCTRLLVNGGSGP